MVVNGLLLICRCCRGPGRGTGALHACFGGHLARGALLAVWLVSVGAAAQTDSALEAHRKLWNDAGLNDYEFRYRKICECHRDMPADTIIRVSQGAIVAVRYHRDDYLADVHVPPERYEWFRTVDDLFSLVDRAQRRQAVVRVDYDADLGYPTRLFIDYDLDLVGEEVQLRILEVTEAR